MSVLLSIKPKYADLIFSGEKQYEFRRAIFKTRPVTKIVVYASSPISKIIGEFEIDKVLTLEIADLWSQTMKFSGINKDFYDSYFIGKDIGHAIKVKKPKKYKVHKELKDFNIKKAPQSFTYLKQ